MKEEWREGRKRREREGEDDESYLRRKQRDGEMESSWRRRRRRNTKQEAVECR